MPSFRSRRLLPNQILTSRSLHEPHSFALGIRKKPSHTSIYRDLHFIQIGPF
jgi:hypothetical protein